MVWRMIWKKKIAALVILISVAACLVTWLPVPAGIQGPVRFLFVLLAPGLAMVPLLQLRDAVADLTLTVTLSLAVVALVALLSSYAGAFSASSILIVLVCFTLCGALAQLILP